MEGDTSDSNENKDLSIVLETYKKKQNQVL